MLSSAKSKNREKAVKVLDGSAKKERKYTQEYFSFIDCSWESLVEYFTKETVDLAHQNALLKPIHYV